MQAGDAELEMRGRKFTNPFSIDLRCLLRCGILAVDELTTNLDVPNAESLAATLLSWQPSTVAEDIVYVFLCCHCGFGNILAYWSNCMYLT
ncbi:unnamed protein product [Lactuca saligna]|uniref:Uncharacterized protein n=1 Tax=Lactuca saligna TaxID=75948 RepID=A0AA35VHC6_LACSI|nr:unnamed protein product [Lactuca saligna]